MNARNPQSFSFNWLDMPDPKRISLEALLFQFSQTQNFPEPDIRELQFEKLKNIFNHSTRHVAHYQNNLYSKLDTWEDWLKLPVLTRNDVQENHTQLKSQERSKARDGAIYDIKSSGSTGRPIHVQSCDRAQIYWQATTLREHLWHQRDFSKSLAVVKYFSTDKAQLPGVESRQWGPGTGLLFATGPSIAINSSNDISAIYQRLRELSPGYLLTYPSVLKALATINSEQTPALSFAGITSIGETLSQDTRDLAQSSFSCKVNDIYSCQEMGYLALQCPKHDHYHVQSETTFVEILDKNNRPCAPGEMGRVVATHLHNYVMPLIRYEIGDYAIAGNSCDCGINLPVIERVVGRTRNLITYPSGKKNWPSYNPSKLLSLAPGSQFQLTQTSVNKIVVKIVSKQKASPETFDEMKRVINHAMGHDFVIVFRQVDHIPRGKNGKYEEFISDVSNV